MTDYKFVNFTVKEKQSNLNVIAFCKTTQFAAIGNDNGIVEIRDTSQNYLLLKTIIVSNINSVEALDFIDFNGNIKLVGLASSKLFIIDVSKGCISDEIILSNNVCGRSISQCGNMLAVGCDSGYLFLYEYVYELRLLKTIRDIEKMVLTLTWSSHFKDILVAGSIGKIYRINLKTYDVQYFNLGNESSDQETFVWCSRFVGKYLFTGDSRGMVMQWDPSNFGVLNRYATHATDVLCLASSNNFIYASGGDPKVVTVDIEQSIITHKRYGMDGSIRGMYATDKSLLAVGTAGTICVYELNLRIDSALEKFIKIEPEHKYKCQYVNMSRSSVIFLYNNKGIDIYELSHRKNVQGTINPYRKHLFTVYAREKCHIQSWTVSDDLKYLVYSTNTETKILKLHFALDHADELCLRIKRFNASDDNLSSTGKLVVGKGEGVTLRASSLMRFAQCKENLYLIIVESSLGHYSTKKDDIAKVCIYEIVESAKAPLLRTSVMYREEIYYNDIHNMEVSQSGDMVAFSTLDGLVFVYSLETFNILMQIVRQNTAGSMNPPRAASMSFNSTNKRLVAIFTNKQIYDVHVGKQMRSVWCKSFNRNLPDDWLYKCNVRQMIPLAPNKFFLLVGKKVIVKIDMEKKIPDQITPLFNDRKRLTELKLQNIKRKLRSCHLRVSKLRSICINLEKQDRPSELEQDRLKIVRIEAKIQTLKNMDLKEEVDCCFTWVTARESLIGLYYLPTENVILTFSREKEDVINSSYSKKMFGL